MTRMRRPSAQTAAVLRTLVVDSDRWRYGYDLCAELGLQAGSMYPILIRLADRGLLETSWEAERVPGRPARHLYRLTAAGREYAATVAAADAHAATEAAARDRVAARDREAAPGPARGSAPGAVPGAALRSAARGSARRPGQQPQWEEA